ncbi:ptpla domain protein [Anaeramoeba ignava]|uniref:very-long-chain (3R)-3-hydroxyacyl-CoA dehydratase n=1 Tax=Anaeramoeba ignava TaxID=1746090 RepID=A0A9Q0RI97_ANAIG|nr:ptpla domain protein [Anaeramoeba ignava]
MNSKKTNQKNLTFSNKYLAFYNGIMLIGWSIIFGKGATYFLLGKSPFEIYKLVKMELFIFQTGAILEIIHSLPFISLVSSPLFSTFIQVFSRVFLIWGILNVTEKPKNSPFFISLILAWSPSEIIRYSYYLIRALKKEINIVTWLRYSLFIVLYPIGVVSEIMSIINSLPETREKKIFQIKITESFNFEYSHLCIGIAVSYVMGFSKLYLYMLNQRRKHFKNEKQNQKQKQK